MERKMKKVNIWRTMAGKREGGTRGIEEVNIKGEMEGRRWRGMKLA